ncbi:MAG TPA: LamG domain-containing protein [Verrucomicrobiae bacterium]|jgi:hypothetical protein
MKKNSNSHKVLFQSGWFPLLAAFLMVLWMPSSTVLATPPTPLLHYTFDDGVGTIDATDTGVAPQTNGVFNGNATRTTTTPNGTGYALDLSSGGAGVNDYVHCGDPAKLNSRTTLSNALTLTAWINLQAVPVAKDRVMSKISTTGGFDLYFNNASATAAILNFDVNSTSGGCFSSAINMSQRWVFVAVTYDATTNASNVVFYTGGTNTAATLLNTTSLGAGLIKNSGLEFRVGSTAASSSDRTPPAWMDDVRIYDSVLSAADLEVVRTQGGYPSPMSFLVQPVSQTVYPYPATTNVTFSVIPSSTPDYLQWFYNGTNAANAISGATNATLSLINPTAAAQGAYYIIASNSTGVAVSTAGLTMVVTNSGRLNNIWNLLPGDRPYITVSGSTNAERGLAYDALPAVGTGGDLLVMSLASTNLVVLNATNGAEKYFMNLGGIAPNTVAVAGDGKVYAANATAAADAASYFIYQWPDDSANNTPSISFGGDPGFFTPATGLRWGDNLAVRGADTGTQILIAPGSGTNVCLFTTADGANFSPNIITVSNVPSGFAQFGVAFGPGTNTFWAKTRGQQLYLVQYDPNTLLGGPIYSTFTAPSLCRFISTDPNQKWLAGVTTLTSAQPDIVTLFDISSLLADPAWVDGTPYATANRSTFLSGVGTGVTVFGGTNYVFALDSNNGIKAFVINSVLPLTPFNVTSITMQPGPAVALTWQSVSGHNYQIQAKSALTDASWSNVGPAVPAAGTSTSATNGITGGLQFYRVQGN